MKSELLTIIALDSEITRLGGEKKKISELMVQHSELLILTFINLKNVNNNIEDEIPYNILCRIRSGLNKLLNNKTITSEINRRLTSS
jgi:hypothetical protein